MIADLRLKIAEFKKDAEATDNLKSKIYNHKSNIGVWYSGITHASGACNPGSIPGTPTKRGGFKKIFPAISGKTRLA